MHYAPPSSSKFLMCIRKSLPLLEVLQLILLRGSSQLNMIKKFRGFVTYPISPAFAILQHVTWHREKCFISRPSSLSQVSSSNIRNVRLSILHRRHEIFLQFNMGNILTICRINLMWYCVYFLLCSVCLSIFLLLLSKKHLKTLQIPSLRYNTSCYACVCIRTCYLPTYPHQ